MSAWTNLAAIGVNAGIGDTNNWATKKQVGAIAGRLGKLVETVLANQMGLSVGKDMTRGLRLLFLNDALAGIDSWGGGGGPITTTKQLSFGAASAVLDWLEGSSAAEDMKAWLMEQGLPYAEVLFE